MKTITIKTITIVTSPRAHGLPRSSPPNATEVEEKVFRVVKKVVGRTPLLLLPVAPVKRLSAASAAPISTRFGARVPLQRSIRAGTPLTERQKGWNLEERVVVVGKMWKIHRRQKRGETRGREAVVGTLVVAEAVVRGKGCGGVR